MQDLCNQMYEKGISKNKKKTQKKKLNIELDRLRKTSRLKISSIPYMQRMKKKDGTSWGQKCLKG